MIKFLARKVHSSSLFLSFIVGIIFGAIFSLVFRINFFSSIYWLVFVLILLAYGFLKPTRFFLIILFIAGGILASFRVAFELKNQAAVSALVGETVEISGKVGGDPSLKENMTALKLVYNGAAIYTQVYIPKGVEVRRGDILTVKGKISEGFGTYAAAIYRPELLKVSKMENNYLVFTRERFSSSIKNNLSEDEAGLSLSYLVGLRTGLSEEITEALAVVGLTHIVVASGTHLSIIVEFMKKIFGKISMFSGMFFGILFILVFAELVGWTASITRAAIVAVLSILAWYGGRKIEPGRIILIAMGVTLLIDPMNLINLGWLLSFGSFSGILILSPRLVEFFYSKKKPGKITEILIATISATIMTAPILLYYFGSLSIISLIANLLILPTIPVAMGLTFLTGLSGLAGFLAPITVIISKITAILLEYHLTIIRFFGAQKMFLISIPKENPLVFLIYIPVFLPLIISKIRKYRARKLTPKKVPVYFNEEANN